MYDNNNYPNDYLNRTGAGHNETQTNAESGQSVSNYTPYRNAQDTEQGIYGSQSAAQGGYSSRSIGQDRYAGQGTSQGGYGGQSTEQGSYGSRSIEQSGYGGQSSYGSQSAEQGNYSGRSGAGSYQYGNVYPNNYAQTVQKPAKKKKEKKPGGFFKKALVTVALGLFFGVFAGLGLYTVEYATGMLDGKSDKKAEAEVADEKTDEPLAKAEMDDEAQKAPAVDEVQIKQADGTMATAVVTDVTDVVKKVMPSIVAVNNHYTETMSWFGQSMDSEADASGSGIIVGLNDSELLIVSNHHVVADTDKLTVQFNEGSEAEAFIKGQDSKMDLAVIAVPVTELSDATLEAIEVATLGNSDDLEVGEPAIAIGNSLGYGQSVTTGVISALDRSINLSAGYGGDNVEGTFIQTDAAINPGNSGGALLNIRGEVIGINSNKIGGSAVEGMGYAIPISAASPIIAELMLKETKSKVAEEERGYLGISGISVTQEVSQAYGMPEGVYIAQVYEGTAAAAAGLKQGDIITEFGGDKIASMEELQKELEFYAKGTTVEIKVMTMTVAGYEEATRQLTLGNKVTE